MVVMNVVVVLLVQLVVEANAVEDVLEAVQVVAENAPRDVLVVVVELVILIVADHAGGLVRIILLEILLVVNFQLVLQLVVILVLGA